MADEGWRRALRLESEIQAAGGIAAVPSAPAWPVSALALGWRRRAAGGELMPEQIHLWAWDMGLEAGLDGGAAERAARRNHRMALLSEAESARAARFRNHRQRAMYLGGRIGMRLLLRAYTGLANRELRFGYGPRGKPTLLNALGGGELCFNYTLSGGQALYAVAWNRQVGIDMETWPRKINARALASRKLTPAEQRRWGAIPAASQDQAMLACWTRKEAYGKALGVGIRYTLNQAPVFIDIERPDWRCAVRGLFHPQPAGAGAGTGQLHGLQLAPPFAGIAALVHDGAALASPAEGESLRAWRLDVA